jgi:hypothetical protein
MASTRCPSKTNVILLEHVLKSYFITDESNDASRRRNLEAAFSKGISDLREETDRVLSEVRDSLDCVLACRRDHTCHTKGGNLRDQVADFLDFKVWNAPLPRESHLRPERRESNGAHSSGPRTIDYARNPLTGSHSRHRAPLDAGFLRAFGQTRDPRGHRA